MDPASVSSVAARARTENFPVASLLFPRAVRPHLRAVYGFARLVDILGDEFLGERLDNAERSLFRRSALAGGVGKAHASSETTSTSDVVGNRLAALDELEREVDACYGGEPTWEVMRALQPTICDCSLPREPFLRLIEANRIDQRVSEYETWADLKDYCVHSADPVGRLVLGVLGRAGDPEAVALSDNVCTGLQLVNFLQDVPRDLALGRVYLPAEDRRRFGVTELSEPNEPLRRLLEFEAERARGLLASGDELGRRLGGRVGRAVALFGRGGLAALEALERADWDIFNGRPRPSRARLALAAIR
ncbi:MAG TPA: squalene synthase HpnC [Gaiellaceae bacterium]